MNIFDGTQQLFTWQPTIRGRARSVSAKSGEGISWKEEGIENWQATGATLRVPFFLGLKAEALYLTDRASEALEAIKEAEKMAETFEERWWCAELRRLRGVFLAALNAEETQIEGSLCEVIRIAKQQKSVSLAERAEATYAEYRRQKAWSSTTSLVTNCSAVPSRVPRWLLAPPRDPRPAQSGDRSRTRIT